MPTMADALHYTAKTKPTPIPIGTRVRVRKLASSKGYVGMEGHVIEYGHPSSRFDHLVYLPDIDQNRWFYPPELDVIEETNAHTQP